MVKTFNNIEIVGLMEAAKSLKSTTSDNSVKRICGKYIDKLSSGVSESLLVQPFLDDISDHATDESVKSTVVELTNRINEHKRDISVMKSIDNLSKGQSYIIPMIEESLVSYLTDKTSENRNKVKSNLSIFESISDVKNILEALNIDEYEQNSGTELHNVSILESVDDIVPAETFTRKEVDEMIAESNKAVLAEQEKKACEKPRIVESIETNIKMRGTLESILGKTKNEDVRVLCERYLTALNHGKSETMLLEEFVSTLSRWNYLPAVETEMSALKKRIENYRQNIDLRKILEMMETTSSYYIVPLIKDYVIDYCENKNVNTRAVLFNRLSIFESDQYVRDIISIIESDDSIRNTVVLGESVEALNPYVKVVPVYSPVKYIKENESVFNVRGNFYTRKGDKIIKMNRASVASLSESFKNLCSLVNSDNTIISEAENTIHFYSGHDHGVINESSIMVNGAETSVPEMESNAKTSYSIAEGNHNFYNDMLVLNENFNNISYIDFVKHVESKRDKSVSADVFRLGNGIFVNLTNESMGTSTFYSNVNPMQCRAFLNEHMGINVGPLFEDMLPGQQTILEGIEDTKKEFEDYLDELNSNRTKLEGMKESNPDSVKEIDAAIAAIDDEMASIRDKYDQYSDDSAKYTGDEKGDADGDYPEKVKRYNNDEDTDGNETPEEMQEPINGDVEGTAGEETEIENPDVLDDIDAQSEPDEFAGATEFGEFDTPVVPDQTSQNNPYAFKVLRVDYLENLKTGKTESKGEVFLVVPSVDANGDVRGETKKVTFYLNPDRNPVINNEYMPADMYIAIKNAILNDERTSGVEVGAGMDTGEPSDLEHPISDITQPVSEPETEPEVPAVIDAETDTVSVAEPDAVESEPVAEPEPVVSPESTIEQEPVVEPEQGPEDEKSDAAEQHVHRESPAETEETENEIVYPISMDINPIDLKPITKDEFEKSMDDMGIEHSESESEAGSICIKPKDLSEVHALKKYFKKWKNYDDKMFCTFFPELEACIMKECGDKTNINESEKILDVKKVSSDFEYVFPKTEQNMRVLGINESKNDDNSMIGINFDSDAELLESYTKFSALESKGEIDEDVKSFLDANRTKCEKLIESSSTDMCVPYSSILESVLAARGVCANRQVNGMMSFNYNIRNASEIKSVLESFYGGQMSEAVRENLTEAGNRINESIKIDITDNNTGKTVTVYTSEDGKEASESASSGNGGDKLPDFNSSFSPDVTFNEEDTMMFKDDEKKDEDKDGEKKEEEESEDKKDEEKKEGEESGDKSDEENGEEEKKEDEESEEDNKESEDKPESKKRFVFKKKSKNESVKENPVSGKLNESELAKPNVYDNVVMKDGSKGQIIGQMGNGNFIVHVSGRTFEAAPSEVKMEYDRPDTLECPYKFDKNTLKGLFEQMAPCGMFINGMRITSDDCYVRLNEFLEAKPGSKIDIILEGERNNVDRDYIRLTESLDNLLNIGDYAEGNVIDENGISRERILINKKDFGRYVNESAENNSVRVLAFDTGGGTKLLNLSGTNLKIK